MNVLYLIERLYLFRHQQNADCIHPGRKMSGKRLMITGKKLIITVSSPAEQHK